MGKRMLAVILSIILGLISFVPVALSQTNYGDVNGDGLVTNIDLILLRRYLAGITVEDNHPITADVNGDGSISNIDLVLLRRYIAGIITELGPQTESLALMSIGDEEALKGILSEMQQKQQEYRVGLGFDERDVNVSDAPNAPNAGSDYSDTNVQVQGVDEADIVKTDGEYIYSVSNNNINVIDTSIPEDMKVIHTIKFDENSNITKQMYLDKDYLTIIGTDNGYYYDDVMPMPRIMDESAQIDFMPIAPPFYSEPVTKMWIYDIKDKTDIKKVRELEIDGRYLSSRKIDSNVYVVTNKTISFNTTDDSIKKPGFKDSLAGEGTQEINYSDIRYFPESVEPNYLLITGLDLSQIQQEANVSVFLGSGTDIYVSKQNMYITYNLYENVGVSEDSLFPRYEQSTQIFKFELEDFAVNLKAKGKVPGRILNQFSMDEHEGYFRIATTTGEMWREDEFTSKNNVFILDNNLDIAGELRDVAPTESIYSMRFMGDRGYMVTFRQVDPFYVLDLHDPNSPKILGYLKIPGYSNYLHPYDENHIMGFGKEVDDNLFGGMKVAVFDVTDVANPVEKFNIQIGDRGTDSELLWNHKALLFSKDKGLLAFPVTVWETTTGNIWSSDDKMVFQGAYVYSVDMEKGFNLKAKITHGVDEHFYDYYNSKKIQRVVYIDDTLFTLSNWMIKANGLWDFEEKSSVVFVDDSSKIGIRGIIKEKNVKGNGINILVEGSIENDTHYDKAYVQIEEDTIVYKNGNIIDNSGIKLGDKVEVIFEGPVAESYPVQGTASKIKIIS